MGREIAWLMAMYYVYAASDTSSPFNQHSFKVHDHVHESHSVLAEDSNTIMRQSMGVLDVAPVYL